MPNHKTVVMQHLSPHFRFFVAMNMMKISVSLVKRLVVMKLKKYNTSIKKIASVKMLVKKTNSKYIPVYKILLIIPGNTVVNNGKIFKYAANIEPPFTWCMFLAARDLCTRT